jgi:ribosomal protein S12 methylthiotransferase accessory factor
MPTQLGDPPFTTVAASLERLEPVVSPLSGIVTATVRNTYAPDDARLVWVSGRTASCKRTTASSIPEWSGGTHPSSDVARAAALGEAVERYSGAYARADATILATARDLGPDAVAPERFALFHRRQLEAPRFPFVEFDSATRVRFVEGFALDDGSPAFVPSQLVFMSGWFPDEERIGLATSNGLACGATLEEAILAALYEVVERDAVMLAWKNSLSLPLLDWSDDEEIAAVDRRVFAPTGLRYSVLDGSAFFDVPVAIGVVHGPPDELTALGMGGGAGPTVSVAWLKALAEAFGVRRWLSLATLAAGPLPEALDVKTFDDHMLFYARHEKAMLAAFLDASDRRTPTPAVAPIPGDTPRAQIGELLRRLSGRGCSAYVVDVTPPDVASLGLHVVRVVAPELCALDVLHSARFLGGRRLYRAAHDAGVSDRAFRFEDLNPLPHPFP